MVLAHPAGGKGQQRQPEQRVQIGPEHAAGHMPGRMPQMMVVVPVDAHVDEAQDMAQEHRQQRCQGDEVAATRHLHLQHHDGGDDGQHAIAECFKSALAHMPPDRHQPACMTLRRSLPPTRSFLAANRATRLVPVGDERPADQGAQSRNDALGLGKQNGRLLDLSFRGL